MTKLTGYDLYRRMGSPKYVVAPMVDQSELAFRMLCKKYGAQLTYTPMFHSRIFVESEHYRKQLMQVCDDDYPLMLQFCGNDPETVLRAAKMALQMADEMTTRNAIATVDLNLGCPQQIAKRGHYGSFLMEEQELIRSIVSTLHKELPVPVSCKIRVFPDVKDTIAYAKMLEESGCQILAVHGRRRDQRGHKQGLADWEQIRMVKQSVSIPVISNGNIRNFSDIDECIKQTGVDAVMVADSILANPAFFANNPSVDTVQLAQEYLDVCEKHLPPTTSSIRGHLFKILKEVFTRQVDLRQMLALLSFSNRNMSKGKMANDAKRLRSTTKDENDDSENTTLEERIGILKNFREIIDKLAERESLGETVTVLPEGMEDRKEQKRMRKLEAKKRKQAAEASVADAVAMKETNEVDL